LLAIWSVSQSRLRLPEAQHPISNLVFVTTPESKPDVDARRPSGRVVPSRAAKVSALLCTAPLSVRYSANDQGGSYKLLVVTGLHSPFAVITARGAVPPKAQLGPCRHPVVSRCGHTKAACWKNVLAQRDTKSALSSTMSFLITPSATEQLLHSSCWPSFRSIVNPR